MRLLSRSTRPRVIGSRLSRRAGRVLVECCIAVLLLAIAGSGVLLVTAGSVQLVDESLQRDRVQRATREAVATAEAVPCAIVPGATHHAFTPRVLLDVVAASAGHVRALRLDARWQTAPLAGSVWKQHRTLTSAWCE